MIKKLLLVILLIVNLCSFFYIFILRKSNVNNANSYTVVYNYAPVLPNYFFANGIWIPEKEIKGGVISDYKINAVDLTCEKNENICRESRSYMYKDSNTLSTLTLNYNIDSWDNNAIIATGTLSKDGVVKLKIDLLEKTIKLIDSRDSQNVEVSRLSRTNN